MDKQGEGADQQFVEQVAQRIDLWGMTLPAIVFLEATKPISFIASQGLLLCQPLLGFFSRERAVGGYADLLADRARVEVLIARLERGRSTRGTNGKEKG